MTGQGGPCQLRKRGYPLRTLIGGCHSNFIYPPAQYAKGSGILGGDPLPRHKSEVTPPFLQGKTWYFP